MTPSQKDNVTFVDQEEFTVVGVECRDPPLMIYAWIALAARRHEIVDVVDPHLLFGVWHRTSDHQGQGNNACLVGCRVGRVSNVPEGLVALNVPACRFAVFEHRGHIGGIGATYERIHEWCRGRPKATERPSSGVGAIEIYDTNQALTGDYRFPILEPAP